MEAKPFAPDLSKIESIIQKRLVNLPLEAKAGFPPILREPSCSLATVTEPEYLMVAFLNSTERDRVESFRSQSLNPFPGLITTAGEPALFRLDRTRHAVVGKLTGQAGYSFSLGPDSTLILIDYHVSLPNTDIGGVSYSIPLAYVISYGDEIYQSTVYGYFSSLVAYSTDMWRQGHEWA